MTQPATKSHDLAVDGTRYDWEYVLRRLVCEMDSGHMHRWHSQDYLSVSLRRDLSRPDTPLLYVYTTWYWPNGCAAQTEVLIINTKTGERHDAN